MKSINSTSMKKLKKEFINKIKESDLDSSKDLKNKVSELNNLKQQVESVINDPQNFVSNERKQKLTKDLTDAKTKEEIAKVRNEATLEKKKHEAIELANKILKDKPQELTQVTNEINSKNNERSIDAIISRIKGDKVQSLKLEAESKVEKLEFISEIEKQRIIAEIEKVTTENHTEIDNIVTRITEKNKEKQGIFDSIKNSQLFDKEHIDQNIKKSITDNDEKTAYTKVKDDFVKLENQKKEIKNKLDQSNNNFNSLGQNDIKKLTNKLINATTSEQIQKIERDANDLNNFKKDLIDKVNKLSNVDSEKQQAVQKIKEASTREEAQKIYDDLALKSKQNDSTANIQKHEYLSNNEKRNFTEQIKKASKDKIEQLLQEAKTLNDKKKAQADKITNLDNTNSLLKQETKDNAINSIKSTDGEQNAINKYNEVKNIFDKKTTLFNSINDAKNNSQITDNAKNQLINKLKENDAEKNITNVQSEFNKWKENYPKYLAAINSLNNVKQLIEEISRENPAKSFENNLHKIDEFIKINSLVNSDNVDKLIQKKSAIYSQEILSKFNSISSDIEKIFEARKLNNNDVKMKDKSELTLIKQKLINDFDKFNSIKSVLSQTFTNYSFETNDYNSAVAKEKEIEKWFEQKIDLVDKHNNLLDKVKSSKYLNKKGKEKWENKIDVERIKQNHGLKEFDKLNSDIEADMAKNKVIIDKYTIAINEYKDTTERIKSFDKIVSDFNLKVANQSIAQNNYNIIQEYDNEYQNNFDKELLESITSKITKNNSTMETYYSSLNTVKVYLDRHARNQAIKDSAWKEFQYWMTFNSNTLKQLGTDGVKDMSQFNNSLNDLKNKSIRNVKVLVFKKEIMELIGNGKWSLLPERPWYGTHVVMSISYAWIENPTANNASTKVHLDDKWYKPTYLNMKIDWNADKSQRTDATKSSNQANHWDYWPKGIMFSSGDEDNIKYMLSIKRSDSRTFFVVVTIPDNHKYKGYTAHPSAYKPNADSSTWIKEEDLKWIP